MLLKIEDLHTNYGAIHALKGISLEVNEGRLHLMEKILRMYLHMQ